MMCSVCCLYDIVQFREIVVVAGEEHKTVSRGIFEVSRSGRAQRSTF
jgi:hypothetical protein